MQRSRMQPQSVAKWRRLKMYVFMYWDRQRSVLTKLPPSCTPVRNTSSKYIRLFSHLWANAYNTNALRHTRKPLNVTSCSRLYQWAISCSVASSGRTKLAENKSHIERYENGEITVTFTNLHKKV